MAVEQSVAVWHRSSRCGDNACVEVARTIFGFELRDAKDPEAGTLQVSDRQWASFVAGIRSGDFDRPRLG